MSYLHTDAEASAEHSVKGMAVVASVDLDMSVTLIHVAMRRSAGQRLY